MPTYKQIAAEVKKRHGYTSKTCWIADVKAQHGLTRGSAPNRISATSRRNPCPVAKIPDIEAVLRHFQMIP